MQNLFKLLFVSGLFSNLILSLPQYSVFTLKKTWNDARKFCQQLQGDLATIKSADDMLRLKSVAQSQQFNSNAWVGLYNEIVTWRWSYQNDRNSLQSFRAWGGGQPEKEREKECALIDNGKWATEGCKNDHPFICYDDNLTSSQYIKVTSPMSWYNAQNYCRRHHTDLASARNQTENKAIIDMIGGKTWFGLFTHSWKWVEQTNVSGITWKDGHPDNKDPNDCVFLNSDSLAEDTDCSNTKSFFCSGITIYPGIIRKRQMISLKVRSEQDANDPQVQAAILEKIRDKLREFGVTENVTVSWRKLPEKTFLRMENESLPSLSCDKN